MNIDLKPIPFSLINPWVRWWALFALALMRHSAATFSCLNPALLRGPWPPFPCLYIGASCPPIYSSPGRRKQRFRFVIILRRSIFILTCLVFHPDRAYCQTSGRLECPRFSVDKFVLYTRWLDKYYNSLLIYINKITSLYFVFKNKNNSYF